MTHLCARIEYTLSVPGSGLDDREAMGKLNALLEARWSFEFENLEQMDELTLAWKDEKELPGGKTFVFQLNVLKPSEDAVLSNETVTVTVEVEHK